MFLLTTTAERFFPKFGFEQITRDEVPETVQASVEFTSRVSRLGDRDEKAAGRVRTPSVLAGWWRRLLGRPMLLAAQLPAS